MSAGHSLRRQNYSYLPPLTPPVTHPTREDHHMRVLMAIVSAIAVNLATFATIAMLSAGR
jgi:hypothetical protein